jgi:cell division protein FtsW
MHPNDSAPPAARPGSGLAPFRYDGALLVAAMALVLIGYVMVTSASLHIGERLFGDSLYFPRRQLLNLAAGVGAAAACALVPLAFWLRVGPWLMLAGIVLLAMVLVEGLGVEVNGSMRWLSVAGLRIQVSELVKLFAVVELAGYIARHPSALCDSHYGVVRPLLPLLLVSVLLLAEPDFGAAAVILTTALLMLFLAGARLPQFVVLVAAALGGAGLLVHSSPYRWQRLTGFLNPWADPLDSGFQLIQALIGLGRGEWLGVGLGAGIQKLFYLPEAHTDFIFSVVGEELGLLGVLSVIVLFAVVVWRAFRIGERAEVAGQRFAAFLAFGIAIWFGLQAFINMGVNMGILPTKGLTLPLMSYGGSSLVVMCAALGLLCRVHTEAGVGTAGAAKGVPAWSGAS